MSDQCGLCLSCGVPFLPDVSKIELFNRAGVLSVMFLNNEYSRTAEITQLYESPKFASEKHLAHLFHDSHHGVAIKYMCDLHDDDEDVGVGFVPAHNALIPAGQLNAPFLYFKTPTSKNFKGPQAAMWVRPRQDQRLNLRPLCIYLRAAANRQQTIPIGHNLGATVSTCMGCNMIMTQQADIRYLLGYKTVGQRNTNTPVIEERPIHQYTANAHQATLDQAYGVWTIVNPPAVPVARPAMDDADSDSPHVAYYLHKCLPFKAAARDWFASAITRPAMRASVRRLYVEQSWLLLEIAAVATLVERGKVTEPGGRLSHGLHQHFGVLDLYVSFFLFRLIEFKHGRALRRTGVDFVQWHQKYYCEALNCRGLFNDHQNRGVMAQRMYSTTDQNTKELIEQLCGNMLAHLNGRLEPLVRHVTGGVNVPRPIERFFVPTGMLRTLRNKSRASRETDFQSALGKFGINALLQRIIRLCKEYPSSFRRQLLDFRVNWQWLEIDRVQEANGGLAFVGAYRLYYMCMLMDAPDALPASKEESDALFEQAEFCSHWNAVLALDNVGALQDGRN